MAPTPDVTENTVVADLAPLGDNLLWVIHYDNATQEWSVYDPTGFFSPDALPVPPGESAPDISQIGTLTSLTFRNIYWITVSRDQTAVLGGVSRTLVAGANLIVW